MKKLLAISCAAVLVLYGISVITASGDSLAASQKVSPVLLAAAASSQPIAASSLSPGTYLATPNAALVVVPKTIDLAMMVAKNDATVFRML